MSLGEQIAVLDGLAAFNPEDGRIGQRRASVAQYAQPKLPGVLRRTDVLDASEGANYSGGSSYAPRLPLLPSSIGLANIPNVLPERRHVIDYSGGANYSGGSDWVPGLPMLPSSAGLADSFIRGGYGRAGLGAPFIAGGYGRAGLGETGSAVDEDLAAAAEAVATERHFSAADGRIGQMRAQVDEYGQPVIPGVLARSDVLDASEGGNYSGGSSYAPRLPLLPSSVGLAGLDGALAELQSYDDLDGVRLPLPKAITRVAGRTAVKTIKRKAASAAKKVRSRNPRTRAKGAAQLNAMGQRLARVRQVRRAVAQQGGRYATRGPQWAQ
jgi:hypothetical protein